MQVAADLRYGVAHVIDCTVDRRSDDELDESLTRPFAGVGRDFVHPADSARGGFDPLRYLCFQFRRCSTRLVHDYTNRRKADVRIRSEEHTSELQSLMRNSYAVFRLKKKKKTS